MHNHDTGNTSSTVALVSLQCMDARGQAWAATNGKTTYDGYRWYIAAMLA